MAPLVHLGIKMLLLAKKSRVLKAKNNGLRNFTLSLGIPDPPHVGNIPKRKYLFTPSLKCNSFLEYEQTSFVNIWKCRPQVQVRQNFVLSCSLNFLLQSSEFYWPFGLVLTT